MRKNRISLVFLKNLRRVFGEKRKEQLKAFIERMQYDCEEDDSNVY
jgi:hypothetical protein